MNMDKIHAAYGLDHIKIELTNGDIHIANTIDIHDAEDDKGNDLGYQFLVFKDLDTKEYHFARNEEIVNYSKIPIEELTEEQLKDSL
jgi:hypothetical protein